MDRFIVTLPEQSSLLLIILKSNMDRFIAQSMADTMQDNLHFKIQYG